MTRTPDEDDGCADPDAALIGLAGAFLIAPTGIMSAETYADLCTRLGVAARPEGWAVWHGWDDSGRPITMVTSKLDTTRGLLSAWATGRDVMPVQPGRGAVAATLTGWYGPAVRSPGHAARAGVSGHGTNPSA